MRILQLLFEVIVILLLQDVPAFINLYLLPHLSTEETTAGSILFKEIDPSQRQVWRWAWDHIMGMTWRVGYEKVVPGMGHDKGEP
ncbi:hypothetical protein Q9966_007427 [Columba livia]|nr:hypothetical protein Q9966_007427 [Columba livia]